MCGAYMQKQHGVVRGFTGEVVQIVVNVKGIIFDGDGVLTDNRVLEGLEGAKPRWRSHYDGQGISLLRSVGIHVCFITNEGGVAAQAINGLVERWNSLPSTMTADNPSGWTRVELFEERAGEKKVEAAEEWLKRHGLIWSECAVMGDDLVDIPVLRKAGLRAAPSSAERVVLDMVHFVSRRPGGSGAIRDLANFILDVKGVDQTSLPTQ